MHFVVEWRIACNFCQKTVWTDVKFLDGSVLKKPNKNRILVFGTSLALRLLVAVTLANHYDVALNCE